VIKFEFEGYSFTGKAVISKPFAGILPYICR